MLFTLHMLSRCTRFLALVYTFYQIWSSAGVMRQCRWFFLVRHNYQMFPSRCPEYCMPVLSLRRPGVIRIESPGYQHIFWCNKHYSKLSIHVSLQFEIIFGCYFLIGTIIYITSLNFWILISVHYYHAPIVRFTLFWNPVDTLKPALEGLINFGTFADNPTLSYFNTTAGSAK